VPLSAISTGWPAGSGISSIRRMHSDAAPASRTALREHIEECGGTMSATGHRNSPAHDARPTSADVRTERNQTRSRRTPRPCEGGHQRGKKFMQPLTWTCADAGRSRVCFARVEETVARRPDEGACERGLVGLKVNSPSVCATDRFDEMHVRRCGCYQCVLR